ncbi:MAG: hypothetical protein IJT36_05470 [Alphaproteobacteria bacterium]|nr:hypothetical protein [Alphaproteobacteria bacterium]
MRHYIGYLSIICLVFNLNAHITNFGIEQKDSDIVDIKSESVIGIKDIKVDQDTNNVDVYFTTNERSKDFSKFEIEIFKAIEDKEGNIERWEKDINTFVQLYPKIQNGIFVSTLRWIGADPKNPASIFKIVFKNENKITTVKIFKLDTPNK